MIPQIKTCIDQPILLQQMVEKLAYGKTGYFGFASGLKEWHSVQTTDIEKYISGTICYTEAGQESLRVPFITSFLFCCIRQKNKAYSMNWNMSFSMN